MKNGAIFGTASMVDGMIDRFEDELGQSCTIVCDRRGFLAELCPIAGTRLYMMSIFFSAAWELSTTKTGRANS